MGGCIACFCRNICGCDLSCCDPKDNWSIQEECHGDELGAGHLFKRGKNHAVWSKRYFTVTNKILYYTEQDRSNVKGEIVLAGARAMNSTTRADRYKKYYLTIQHGECGSREFYTTSKERRSQWIDLINSISQNLKKKSVYGKLLKMGGKFTYTWQERWVICVGSCIDYFENAHDNQSKGSINLKGAILTPIEVKDQKYCIQILPAVKNSKKYVFACHDEYARKKWIEIIQLGISTNNPSDGINPLNNQSENTNNTNRNDLSSETESNNDIVVRITPLKNKDKVKPKSHQGFLKKLGKHVISGWQSRYFVLDDGVIRYYNSVEDSIAGIANSKGDIPINTIDNSQRKGVELVGKSEIKIDTGDRIYNLKAENYKDAQEWVEVINDWCEYCN